MVLSEEMGSFLSVRGDIALAEDGLRRLKEAKKAQLFVLTEAVKQHLLTLSIGQAKEWTNLTYWKDEEFAGLIKAAFKEVLGGQFVPASEDMGVYCRVCGAEATISCKSWSDYKNKRSSGVWGYKCHRCALEQKTELAARREERQLLEQAEMARIEALRALPYKDYLLTEHWQTFRKKVLRRAGYQCQLCDNAGELNVHHRTYDRLGCEWYSDVIVLCRGCHRRHHGIVED